MRRIFVTTLMCLSLGCGKFLTPDEQSGDGATGGGGCNASMVPFGAGSGTANDPFAICSRAHWSAMAEGATSGRSFLLVGDLDFEGLPAPLIDDFFGDFDGGGGTIRNLGTNALFVRLTGSFRNVHFENVTLAAGNNVGAVAGIVSLSGEIENVTVTGTIVGSWNAGAIAGVNNGLIHFVDADATVAGSTRIGGLVGIQNGILEDSFARGSVSASALIAGGIAGSLALGGTIRRVVTGPSTVSAPEAAGGIVGDTALGTVLVDAVAEAAVSGTQKIGGVVGQHVGTMSRVLAAGTVAGTTAVDGICGQKTGTVANNYFDTTASGLSTSQCGAGKTTAQLFLPETFVGWDVALVWLVNGVSYPSLR